ncbi:hypothetical protein V6N12_024569 [Hibiscus sabdariffa]|uniref:Uncharacterized protein n=1 Tax=Hibiscus sabdariffa TaxID=183260 RepID=A0ABR2G1F8_9ROSI
MVMIRPRGDIWWAFWRVWCTEKGKSRAWERAAASWGARGRVGAIQGSSDPSLDRWIATRSNGRDSAAQGERQGQIRVCFRVSI